MRRASIWRLRNSFGVAASSQREVRGSAAFSGRASPSLKYRYPFLRPSLTMALRESFSLAAEKMPYPQWMAHTS